MTENSHLNPAGIKAQSEYAICNLEKDNEAFVAAEKSLSLFYSDTEIKGQSFDVLKQQISDYTIVLRSLRSANDSDIADFNTLINTVGNTVLDGATIMQGIEDAREDMNRYCDTMNNYEDKANNCNVFECIIGKPAYYLGKAAHYAYLVQKQVEIYDEYKNKEQKFDEIESSTKTLFSASESTRWAAQSALNNMSGAFVNGQYVPDMEASWRTDIVDCYYGRIFAESEDGSILINMEEVKKIFGKDAEDITSEEYDVLALAYLNADGEQLETIIQFMMGKRKDYDMNFFQELIGGQIDYSEWKIDKDKSNAILYRTALWAEVTLFYIHEARNTNINMADKMVGQRSEILQRITLLNVVNSIESYRGKYKSDNPTIEITFDDKRELTFTFCEFGLIGSDLNPIVYNLADSKVTIGPTKLGSEIDNTAVDNMKYRFAGYFGNSSLVEDVGKFVVNETTGKLIDDGTDLLEEYATKRFGKSVASNAIGLIPYAGDIASFVIDVSVASNEADQQNQFMKSEFKTLNSALVYDDFDCCANFVEYDIFDNENNDIFVYPGERTDEIISELNQKIGTNLDRNMVLNNSNSVNEQMSSLKSDYYTKSVIDTIIGNKDN